MVGGFECGKTKWLRDGAHHENVGDGVNVTKFLAADKAGKNHIFGNAELGGF